VSRRRQRAPLFRIFDNRFERGIIVRAEPGDDVVIDSDFFFAPSEYAERKPFEEERTRDPQGQFARRTEAGDQIAVDGNCILAPVELAKREPFGEERLRDLFAQDHFARRAEAGDQIAVDGNCILAPVELAKREPFEDEPPRLVRARPIRSPRRSWR